MNVPALELMLANLGRIAAREDQRSRFDLTLWTNGVDIDAHERAGDDAGCGFVGCIVGWAGHEHWFDEMGLRVRLRGKGCKGLAEACLWNGDGWLDGGEVCSTLARFLDVQGATVRAIIYPESYPDDRGSLDEAIERVAFLLEQGEPAFLDRFKVWEDEA